VTAADATKRGVHRLLLAALVLMASVVGAKEDQVLSVGYSAKLYTEVDVNDARAATHVWLKHFIERIGRTETAQSVVVASVDDAVRGVRQSNLDLLVLLPTEYLAVRDQIDIVPMLVSTSHGRQGYRLGLLCRTDRRLALADLQGEDVLLADSGVGDLPRLWIDSALRDIDQPAVDVFFREVRTVDRVARAVLSVFFGQATACIVSLDAYETMVEMNPQLGRELRVVETSPQIPINVICARPEAYEKFGDTLDESMRAMHDDPEGRQILSVFGVDRLIPFREESLDPVRALLHRHDDRQRTGASP